MRTALLVSLLTFTAVFGYSVSGLATMSSDQYVIDNSVTAGGGWSMNAENYEMTASVGQSSAIGISSSNGYLIYAGFWHAIMAAIVKGDINGDGVIDLADAVLALQANLGFDVASIFVAADVNGDGTINIAEVVYVLQNVSDLRKKE